jgi:glycosyltransferase involved in cell wall biosynthesis
MKLLFFSSMKGSPWGGSEELWAAAAKQAVRAGHQVRACVFEWPGPMHPKLAALQAAGIGLIRRPLKRTRILDQLRAPGWLRGIDAFGPDVVCLSQGGAYEAAGRKSVHPFVHRVLATGLPLVNVVQYNDDDDDLRPAARKLAVAINNHAAANAFVASRNIVQAERALRALVPRAIVLRNPVNLPDPSPLPWPAATSPAEFAVVARLQASTKGHDLLIEAFSDARWRERDWRLSCFGEGPDAQAFSEQAATAGLADRITFPGHAASIRDLWASRHVLVLPSRAEGTPLAMVEAMLLGRPCIVTDVGGCTDWVREGIEGWVSPRADAQDINAALERAWSARDHWPQFGRASRDRALSLHDADPGTTLLNMLIKAIDFRQN